MTRLPCLSRLQAAALATIAITVASLPRSAVACGMVLTPEYTITDVWPRDGASGVALDTGFVIRASASSASGGPGVALDVRLTDVDEGENWTVHEVEWYSDQPSAAWRPSQPLRPHHTYRLEVQVRDAQTPTAPVSATFTTGNALLEPLLLAGVMEVTLEGYDAPLQQCEVLNDCGASECVVVGTRPALRAKLSLPAASGGQPTESGYGARLYFTDDSAPQQTDPDIWGQRLEDPHDVNVSRFVALRPGQAEQLEQEVFLEDFAYAPCFTWVVWDPAGHKQEQSKCFPSMTPAELLAHSGASPASTADEESSVTEVLEGTEQQPQDVASSTTAPRVTSSSCAVTPAAQDRNSVPLVLLAALLAGWHRRNRPQPSRRATAAS